MENGKIESNNKENCQEQLITTSLDGSVAFWDLKINTDFQSLNLIWKPFFRVIFNNKRLIYHQLLVILNVELPKFQFSN